MKCILKNGLARFVTKHRLSTRLLFMLVIGTAFHSVASGQERPIQFAVDYAQFRLQRDFVYLEIYYSIPR
ncbi:MAG: hypothetical protein ONB11_11125, partial [candidate division KSB1 bacterium]|nr:hypothetical protein [candidate division KSB1 bacterium]